MAVSGTMRDNRILRRPILKILQSEWIVQRRSALERCWPEAQADKFTSSNICSYLYITFRTEVKFSLDTIPFASLLLSTGVTKDIRTGNTRTLGRTFFLPK